MQVHQLTPTEAVISLNSTPSGLSHPEVERRLKEYGRNGIEELLRVPMWLRLTREFGSFFSLILWVAAGLAFFVSWRDPGQHMAQVGVAIVIVILISGLFSFWQERRVERTLAALRQLLPQQAQVMREGEVTQVAAEELVPGDIVLLEPGGNIPADCRLIEAFAVRVNNAAVTGESMPKARDAAASQAQELFDSRNVVLAGTTMAAGRARAVVFATGPRTEFGKIARLSQATESEVSPLRRQIAHLSRVTAMLALAIGLAFFCIGWLTGIPSSKAFIFAIGIIVAMVPEGLLPTLTLALALATQRMARRKVLIRYLPAVEALGSTTVICTDKTGTLTQNRMSVRSLYVGDGLTTPAELACDPNRVADYRPLFLTARMCHDLSETQGSGQPVLRGDPMEVALVELALQMLPGVGAFALLDEIPFDAERMRLSTLHQSPEGPTLYCKGAPESVLPLCRQRLLDGAVIALDGAARKAVEQAQDGMAERGLRVLALAFRTLGEELGTSSLEVNLVFCGLVGLEDPPRPEVPPALLKCKQAGIKVIMVTGDHPQTAIAIAREIGQVTSGHAMAITGEQLMRLSEVELQLALDAPEIVFARVAADEKMRIVEALKRKGEIVAVTGDGVNDAPALKAAHIGIAMGLSGTDVAKEAADMVLLDDNFASIVSAIEEGRAVFVNVRKFLTYVLVHNVAELMPYLAFMLFRIPLALTAIQALTIDMVTDALAALGLGVERPDPQVMQRPPRPQGERLMNLPLALRAYAFLGLIEGAAALAAFFFILDGAGWTYGQPLDALDPVYLRATTATLSAIIAMQIVNVFLCRSPRRSVLSTGFGGNALILYGVVSEVSLLLVINYTPWGNALLATAPLNGTTWAFMLPFAASMLVLEELRKALARRRKR